MNRKLVKMDQDVYRNLARRLDMIPNGFPQTEFKVLAKVYTPEEAALASEMRLMAESAEQIAQRTGRDPTEIAALLEEMVKKGLIRAEGRKEQRRFGLLPWAVGVYEQQMYRMDEEMARMVEESYPVFAEKMFTPLPSLHKVIPVEKSIPVEVQVFPYEQASAMLENAKSFAVRKCICRVQKALVGSHCKYPEEVCLAFAPIEGYFDYESNARVVTKEQALQILRETEEAGLIHSSSNMKEGHFYICNCCTCCCGIMRVVSQLGIENSIAKSDFYATVNSELCIGCETCVKRCQFHAPSLVDNISSVDQKRCVGCGQCVMTCPSGAMTLVRKPQDQITPTPQNMPEWMMKRAENRGISLEEIL